jgi:hypothetical protein
MSSTVQYNIARFTLFKRRATSGVLVENIKSLMIFLPPSFLETTRPKAQEVDFFFGSSLMVTLQRMSS